MGRVAGNVIRVAPPLVITMEQAEEAVDILERVFAQFKLLHPATCKELQAGGCGHSIVRRVCKLPLDSKKLAEFLASRRDSVTQILCDLIAIPSTRGGEGAAQRYLMEKLKPLCQQCDFVTVPESIVEDPDYSFPIEGLTYADRPNILAVQKGKKPGKTLIFNTHLDTVPPSPGQDNAYKPIVKDGVIYGRGAV